MESDRPIGDDGESRLRSAVADAGIGTWTLDVATDTLLCNDVFAEVLGLDPGAPMQLTTTMVEAAHPDDLAEVQRQTERARTEHAKIRYRTRIRRKNDGAVRWVEATAAFRYDDADVPTSAAGTIRDVTTEVETAEALAISKRRLELALSGSQMAAWEWRLEDDAVILESPPVTLGYALEDLPRTREAWRQTQPAHERDAITQALDDLRDGRRDTVHVDLRTQTKSGELRWVRIRAGSVRDASGKVVRVLGTSVDVTDEKRAEERLQDHARVLESVVEHLPIMVTFYDPETSCFSWVNAAVERILGFSRATWQTPGFLAAILPDASIREAAVTFMRGGVGAGWRRFPLKAEDGRFVETSWCNVLLPDGRMMGIGQDMTFELQLQQTQKLESLGVLAGGIAHDFNNLLVGILTNAHLAKLEVPAHPAVAVDILGDVERSAERLAELTKQLLAYAGKGRFVVEPFDLGDVVREMASLLSAAVSKNAALRVEIPRTLPPLDGDVTQIRQVVMNLITNASDALGERRGEIRIRAEETSFAEARLFETTGPVSPGRFILLEVTDTGMGMTEETRRRIFEPFFTTKFAGRGLGLAATVGIVRRHGGALEVTSELGAGSVFRLYLPVKRQEPRANTTSLTQASAEEGAGAPHVVMVVEDDPLVGTVARRILERHGCTVVLAHDSEEAGRILAERGATLSLVLLDVNTPRGDAASLLTQVAAGFPALPVLVTSGSSDAIAEQRSGPNVVGVLPKPFGHDELVAAVSSVLRRPDSP